MFIAALILSVLGFTLLVVTVILDSHVWSWLMIAVVLAGIVCFCLAEWQKRRKQRHSVVGYAMEQQD